MTTKTVANRSASDSLLHVVAGCLTGLVLFWLLNWVSVQVQQDLLNPRTRLLLGGLVILAAGLLTTRYPVTGLITGLVMAALVGLGWMIGQPLDAMGRTATDLPGEVIKHGAYMPLVVGGAMALIGVGAGLLVQRRRPQEGGA